MIVHLNDYVNVASHAVAIASVIATITPTRTDNVIVGLFTKVIDFFACNWGNAQNYLR